MYYPKLYHLASAVVLMVCLCSCAPSRPAGVLSEDEMEDVLYDMHVAQALYDNNRGADNMGEEQIIALRKSVLMKHDITEAEWDSTFIYYCKNADKLSEVYKSLNERIQANLIALGGKVDGMQGEEADTANVWNMEPYFILMQQSPYNKLSFEVSPDSTFQDGDRLTLQFDAQFIFQDGFRDIATVMAVYYDNDSITTSVSHVSNDGHGVVMVTNDTDRLHVKNIRGYFILGRNLNTESSDNYGSTLRLAAIRNVKLLHTHTTPPQPVQKEETDSLKTDSITSANPDSIKIVKSPAKQI